MRYVIVAIGLLLTLTSPVFGQSPSIQQQLTTTLKALSAELARADQVVARVRGVAKKKPAEAETEVTKVATTLGHLADRLQDQGDVMGTLKALAAAAAVVARRSGWEEGDNQDGNPASRHLNDCR